MKSVLIAFITILVLVPVGLAATRAPLGEDFTSGT